MDKEIPSSVLYGSIAGLSLLGISVILFMIYMVIFNEAYDTSVTLTVPTFSPAELALMVSYLTTGIVGFGLCFLIPYAHYLKSFNDPSVISSKNGLHFETADEDGNLKAEEVVKEGAYRLAGRENNKFVSTGDKYNNRKNAKFL